MGILYFFAFIFFTIAAHGEIKYIYTVYSVIAASSLALSILAIKILCAVTVQHNLRSWKKITILKLRRPLQKQKEPCKT